VPFLVKPLRLRYCLERLPMLGRIAPYIPDLPLHWTRRHESGRPAATLRPIAQFDQTTDAVWRAFAARVGVAVQRDALYMNWRFNKPEENYSTLGAYDDSGRLLGFVIYTAKGKHGGRIGYLMELLFDPAFPEVGAALARTAIDRLADDRCDVALGWCFTHSPNHRAYRAAGFFEFPERLRPIELHFGARAFVDGIEGQIANRTNWYISYADSDTV